ncbi:MAG: hypothetical protein PHX61_11475 [Alphaproteobacteria bacterium]|nr:hypothetical protein [Alphaproteobacteria bacterium]
MLKDPEVRDSGQAIAQIISDFSQRAICPPDIMIQPLLNEFERTAENMSPAYLKKSLISLAYLAISPSEKALKSVAYNVIKNADKFNGTNLTYMLHALTVMDAVQEHHHGSSRPPLSKAYQTLAERTDRKNLRETAHVNIFIDAARWFGQETDLKYPPETNGKSTLETNIKNALRNAGATPLEPTYIRELEHQIDLRHQYNGRSFHVECDGPTHTVQSARGGQAHLNGQTILQTGLLRELLHKPLVRIPYTIFDENMRKAEYWKELLELIEDYKGKTCLFLSGGESPQLEMIGSPDRFASSPT